MKLNIAFLILMCLAMAIRYHPTQAHRMMERNNNSIRSETILSPTHEKIYPSNLKPRSTSSANSSRFNHKNVAQAVSNGSPGSKVEEVLPETEYTSRKMISREAATEESPESKVEEVLPETEYTSRKMISREAATEESPESKVEEVLPETEYTSRKMISREATTEESPESKVEEVLPETEYTPRKMISREASFEESPESNPTEDVVKTNNTTTDSKSGHTDVSQKMKNLEALLKMLKEIIAKLKAFLISVS